MQTKHGKSRKRCASLLSLFVQDVCFSVIYLWTSQVVERKQKLSLEKPESAMCVCVCVREREREREFYNKYNFLIS